MALVTPTNCFTISEKVECKDITRTDSRYLISIYMIFDIVCKEVLLPVIITAMCYTDRGNCTHS